VVDEHENIRLINQSAAEHLGAATRKPGQPLQSVSRELHQILLNWRRHGASNREAASFQSADGMTQVNTYIAPLEQRQDGPVLIFLEDAGLLAEKVQQTKLAALGRLSASIAHEIRNPVGALSHAGQLLQEAPGIGEYEQRLLNIISTNSKRTSEIVDSVLQLSRREPTHPELISLAQWSGEFVEEFTSTLELGRQRIDLAAGQELQVRMDPGHLRQICWNLCENAVKYASNGGEDIIVNMNYGRLPGNRRPFLEIADKGPGISTEMRDQLFEPFATGRVGETGLGLFISRELCECNHAALIYEPRSGGGSVFRVVFADPNRWGPAA
jgi:two-component system sensor histidine kinase PilS (NtrC family)